jgi:phosphoserine phosphatase RsbU/P
LCVLDPQTHQVAVAGAGHMPPLVRSPSGAVREVGSDAIGLPLGLVEGAEYEQARFMLEPGEMVVLYTDGVTEAQDEHQRLYSTARLKEVLTQPAESADVLTASLLADVRRHAGSQPQQDDLCLVIFGRK